MIFTSSTIGLRTSLDVVIFKHANGVKNRPFDKHDMLHGRRKLRLLNSDVLQLLE
jgi:hypothetical protein